MAETGQRIEINRNTAFERSDWPLGLIGLVLLGIFVFLVVAPLALFWAYPDAVSDVGRNLTVMPPAPRLQVKEGPDFAKFRAAEERRLNTYYWVDRSKGIVHIPIAEAMKKLAASGIEGFPKAPR
jgi:hypothetical protein